MKEEGFIPHIDFSQAMQGDNLTVLIVGILIVFIALITLYGVFMLVPKLLKIRFKPSRKGDKNATNIDVDTDISGEESTAIAMALYLYFNEQHDEESYISTIKRVERRYSPWSSKIYSVRNQFNRY